MVNVQETEMELSSILAEAGLEDFVSIGMIRNWIEKGCFGTEPKTEVLYFLNMLTGLLDDRAQDKPGLLERLVNTSLKFFEEVPQSALGGKTIAQKRKEETKEERPIVELLKTTLPPHDWIERYDRALAKQKAGRFTEAAPLFDETFQTLMDERTTNREIYRVFANAGLAYIYSGDVHKASMCWTASLELNPAYTFPRELLDKLDKGEFDEAIKLGLLLKMREGMEKMLEETKRINPQIVGTWSEAKVLGKLSSLGIEVDREIFVQTAAKCNSIYDLSEAILYPNFKGGSSEDEDFVWMAAERLWALYCPDEAEVGALNEILKEELSLHRGKPRMSLENTLCRIETMLLTKKAGFLEHWATTYEFWTEAMDDLIQVLWMAAQNNENRARIDRMVSRLKSSAPRPEWDLIELSVLIYKKDPAWKPLYKRICDADPYNCYLSTRTAHLFDEQGDIEGTLACMEDALATVDRRAQGKVWDVKNARTTVYEDYKAVLDWMEKIYKGHGLWRKMKRTVQAKMEQVNKHKALFSRSTRSEQMNKKMDEGLNEVIRKKALDSPPILYYEYLKKFGIEFKTAEPVEAKIFPIRMDDEYLCPSRAPKKRYKVPKGARRPPGKSPCPCGSKRMYKHCCGAKGR